MSKTLEENGGEKLEELINRKNLQILVGLVKGKIERLNYIC